MNHTISIITVTFNHWAFTKNFLDSAITQEYPLDKYEVIVVDNHSNDDTIKNIKSQYPSVTIVGSLANRGFGAANNVGAQKAKFDYLFFVNNDTLLSKDTLIQINKNINEQLHNKSFGALTGKLVFIDRYLPLHLKNASLGSFRVVSGDKPHAQKPLVRSYKKAENDYEEVLIPLHYHSDRFKLEADLNKMHKKNFELKYADKSETSLFKKTSYTLEITSTPKHPIELVDLIQNAGNFIFRDGHGRDRGAIVINHLQFYEVDTGQYNLPQVVPALNGAAAIISKKLFHAVNGFDHDYFMYYEDVDLSLKLRERGYKIYYCPSVVIRHAHSASSKEWSSFFNFHAERGRLLLLSKHWPTDLALKEWLKYCIYPTFIVPMYYMFKLGDFKQGLDKLILRLKVNHSVALKFIQNLSKRPRLQANDIKAML